MARKEIEQPAGSAVYFAVDFDASAAEIRTAIIPYFRGVARAFAEDNGLPVYRVGVYGSGAVCAAVLDAGLAELAWLSCSTGWSGSRAFLASGRWTLKQRLPALIAGLDADPDDANIPNVPVSAISFRAHRQRCARRRYPCLPIAVDTPPPARQVGCSGRSRG